jgi:hypothetical protein
MTEIELQEIAAEALSSSGRDIWLCEGAGLIEAVGNGKKEIAEGIDNHWQIAWLHFLDPTGKLHHISFRVKHNDREQIKAEMVRQLETPERPISSEIHVDGDVAGTVIGVNEGVIVKNSYGGDTYQQVQFYFLNKKGREDSTFPLELNSPPYKGLSPFTARDKALFKGRDTETAHAVRLIKEQRLLVIHGPAGVGKTSLLAAGIIPQLTQLGAMVIQIQDYASPVKALYEALKSNEEYIKIGLPDEQSLPLLVKRVIEVMGGTLVLMLDQFELLSEPSISVEQRKEFFKELSRTLREQPAKLFRVFIVIRDEAQSLLGELEYYIPELPICQLPVFPLDYKEEAPLAIKGPLLETESPVRFYGDFVEKYLVPDLGELNPEGNPKFVHPPHLQIVCSWLYDKSLETTPARIIDKAMYDENRGADGIIASYVKKTLERMEGERNLASLILGTMAAPSAERWVAFSTLRQLMPDVPVEKVEKVITKMIGAGLIVRRARDEHFSFAGQSISEVIVNLSDNETQSRMKAEKEVERIWLSWLARPDKDEAWASREQLRYLASSGTHLTPQPVKSLLLLRSAVERDEPVQTWLGLLATVEGKRLISRLENPDQSQSISSGIEERPISSSTVEKAAMLVGLPKVDGESSGTKNKKPYGPLTENALLNPDSTTRQTSALVLAALDPDDAFDRLGRPRRAGVYVPQSHVIELHGTLADAGSKFIKLNKSLDKDVRARVWLWRARRRVSRDSLRLFRLTAGGAVGAGLGLMLLRAAYNHLFAGGRWPGNIIVNNFYNGTVLGAALSFGIGLARPLLSLQMENSASTDAISVQPASEKREGWVSIAIGAVCFGLMHFLLFALTGSPLARPLIVLTGFLAGIGISFSLYGLSDNDQQISTSDRLIRIGIASMIFTMAQLPFVVAGKVTGMILFLPVAFINDYIVEIVKLPQAGLMLIDAALTGAVMSAAVMVGLKVASKLLSRPRAR